MSKKWFKIDSAGHLYSSIASTRVTTLFRLSVELKEEINIEIADKAIEDTFNRYNFLKANLKSGFFWYYLKGSNTTYKIEEEKYFPCMNLYLKNSKRYPFRILYFKNKFSFEFSHVLFDGESAVNFIKIYLNYYFNELKDIDIKHNIDDYSIEVERENSFIKYYDKKVPPIKSSEKAYRFKYPYSPKGSFYVVTGIINLTDIKKVSKSFNTSIFIFLTALYVKTIMDINHNIKKPIVINIPVNLRRFFPSNTMSNFFVSLTPSIDPRLGEYTLTEIINYLENYLNLNLNKKNLKKYISSTVKYTNSLYFRLTPLFIKNLIFPKIYKRFGEHTYTTSVSNLGIIDFEDEINKYINQVDFFAPPSMGNIIKATMVSFNNKLSFSFSKITLDNEIEREFFNNLREFGIIVDIENNFK